MIDDAGVMNQTVKITDILHNVDTSNIFSILMVKREMMNFMFMIVILQDKTVNIQFLFQICLMDKVILCKFITVDFIKHQKVVLMET